MTLRPLLILSLVLTATLSARETDTGPNILLILVDDLGYGDLSSYGAPDLKSPHIDALIASGIRLDRFYANCPVCSPTRAALLTGRFPDLVGVPGVIRTHPENSWGYLDPKAPLLPVPLKTFGYHTAIVGKWHLGLEEPNTPRGRGFDFFHGFLGDMMDDYYKHRRHGVNYMRKNEEEIHPKGHATDLFSQWAIDYLDTRKGKNKPFFLYLAYNAPHTPIQPPPEWVERVKKRETGISEKRAKLVALIEHMDDGIGRVMKALEKNGQRNKTLVIFTSDNGGQLNVGARCGPFRGGKQDHYEGGIRVCFGASWPGKIPPGTRSDRVATTMDLYPTITQAAEADGPTRIEGRPILQTLLGREQKLSPRDLIWVRREGGGRYNGKAYHALRRGDWKLVQNHPFEPYQLYNLAEDPREENDLARKESKRFRSMSQALRTHLQKAGRVPWQKPRD